MAQTSLHIRAVSTARILGCMELVQGSDQNEGLYSYWIRHYVRSTISFMNIHTKLHPL